MRVLKMRSAGQPSEVDNNQFRAIIDADPLTTAREAAVELNINHSTVIQHLKQIGKRKISGCLMNWLEIKKIIILKCHLLLFYATTMNNFSFRLWHVTKSGFFYDNWWWPAQLLDQEEAPKHFPKPNLHQKKLMVTFWWYGCPSDALQLSESQQITSEKYAQQINDMLWKLKHLQPALVTRKSLIL